MVDRVHRPAHNVIKLHHAEQGEDFRPRPSWPSTWSGGPEEAAPPSFWRGRPPGQWGRREWRSRAPPSAGEEAGLFLSAAATPQHTDELADVGAQGGHAGGQAALPRGGLRCQGHLAPQKSPPPGST